MSRWHLFPTAFAESTRTAHPTVASAPGGFEITGGRFLVTVLAIASSIGVAKLITWAWRDVCQPLADGFIMRAIIRRRAEHEEHLRKSIFGPDFLAAEEREAMSREALSLGRRNDAELSELREQQGAIHQKLERLPQVADAIERCTESMKEVAKTLEGMNREQGRVAGVLEEMSKRRRFSDGIEV